MEDNTATDGRPIFVSCIILAAGKSQRFGANKMLMTFGKSTVLQSVIDTFDHPVIHEIIVVVSNRSREMIDLSGFSPVTWVVNPDPEKEIGSSLQEGLKYISADSEAVIIAHGDMPLIKKETVAEMIGHFHADSIVIPMYKGRKGHPVLLDRSIVLKCLDGGLIFPLRQIIREHESRIILYDCEDEGVLLDIDTPDDYTLMLSRLPH